MSPRRSNRRKSPPKTRKPVRIQLPDLNWSLFANATVLLGLLVGIYFGTLWALDTQISEIRIEGKFERVSALQVESAITPFVDEGFLSIDLRNLQSAIADMPWVEQASVRRSWPSALVVSITEQRAAARWHKSGLLNVYGELFVEDASHIPAELPHLSGPPGSELQVAMRFFELDKQLERRGLMATELAVDDRGSWKLALSNGMQIRFGAVAVEARITRFLEALDSALAPVADEVDYIDMRYTNGFAIGWKPGSRVKLAEKGEIDPHA